MNPKFPGRSEPLFPGGLPPTVNWQKFFESLAAQTDNVALQADYLALAARVAALEAEGSTDIGSVFGADSIVQVGTLQSGNVFLSLRGDVSNPGNSYYYGTDSAGVKGWHAMPDPASGVLPLVTGEIVSGQPVFVIADDGSLIYTEVE